MIPSERIEKEIPSDVLFNVGVLYDDNKKIKDALLLHLSSFLQNRYIHAKSKKFFDEMPDCWLNRNEYYNYKT